MKNNLENFEKESIDFASEAIPYSILITKNTHESFPKVSDEEMKSHIEKFSCLLGNFKIEGDKVVIEINGTFESGDPLTVMIDPLGHEVRVDFLRLTSEFEDMKKENSELSGVFILGDIHTHPYTKAELGRNPWLPMSTDTESMIKFYKNKVHGVDKPYFSAIVSRGDNGQDVITLYRVVKDEKGEYKVISIRDYEFQP